MPLFSIPKRLRSSFLIIGAVLFLCQSPVLAKTVVTNGDNGCDFVITLNKGFTPVTSKVIDHDLDYLNRRKKDLEKITHPGTAREFLNNMREFYGGADITQEQTDAIAESQRIDGQIKDLEQDKIKVSEQEKNVKDKDVQDLVNKWKNEIEGVWNADGVKQGCCNVKFVVNVMIKDNINDIPQGYDHIFIRLDPNFRPNIHGFQKAFKDGFSHEPYDHDMGGDWVMNDTYNFASHEAGHEMGLDDQYSDFKGDDGKTYSKANAGHESDIMGSRGGKVISTPAGKPELNNVLLILNYLGLKCPDKCCPQHCIKNADGTSTCAAIVNLVNTGVQAYHTIQQVGGVISTAKDYIVGTTGAHAPGETAVNNPCTVGDEGACTPNPCGDTQDCQMITKKSNGAPLDCHMCKEKPKTATGVVDTGGTTTGYNSGGGAGYTLGNCPVNWDYFDDSNCRGKCPSEDCIVQTIDTKTNVIVPQNQTSAHQVQTCYTCKMSYTNYENGCDKAGYYYDDYCDDDCPESACDEVVVDKKTLQPAAWSYAYNNDVLYCYKCISYEKWLERVSHYHYSIIVVETPYGRFVLNHSKDDPTVFHPASVMALAKVDPSTGMVSNINGDPKKITDFIGGFNVGFGSSGIATTGQVGMDQLSNSLQSSLQGGGDFGANCFDNVQKQADNQAASQGTPTSQDISEGKNSHKDSKVDKATDEDQIKKSEEAGLPAVSGPVIACGTQGGNKVLKIFDAGGRLIDSITQGMLKANPSIILQKLGRAQTLTDKLMVKTSFGFAGNSTAIANKPAETNSTIPNDPLYQASNKKKRGFGIFGGDAPSAYKALSAGSDIMSGPSGPKPEDSIEDQYYLRTIGYTPLSDSNSAWNAVDSNQKNIVVAVVDSGLDLDHPDGPQYIWTNPKDDAREGFANDLHGWNFVNENTDLRDFRGHGTSVAGIIAAKSNNGIGMAGINPGAVIMPVKIANDKGETDSLAVYRGINFAVNHGAKIINLSIGGKTISKLEQEAIERANAVGVLVVMAAGNTNDSLMTFGPSSSKHGLAVGMTDFDGSRSNVSNWGPNLAVTAPGEQIYSLCSKDTKEILPSLRKNGYYKQSGTSFSAPMVTATASLVWAKNPQLTNQQVADIIRSTATPMGGNSWSDGTGFGLLNASAALRATADEKLIAMFTNVHFNRDMREQLTSVDVYGTVRGKFKEFAIEAGKGKLTRSFRQIAGPFTEQYNYQLIARLVIKDVLRGSKEWVLRLKVTDNEGKEHDATMVLILPDK